MDQVSLLKRTDTKFIVAYKDLDKIFEELKNDYRVLEINKNRVMYYSSVYFDTEEYKCYYDHHRGKTNRVKVRQRKYVDSDLTFLEIKRKNGKGETIKSRIKIDDIRETLKPKERRFIFHKTRLTKELKASLWNNFHRVTLVNLVNKERVTIDIGLSYAMGSHQKEYPNMVVFEVKQPIFKRNTKIIQTLKKNRYYPYSISKYCIGMINLYDHIKYNLFKPKLLRVNKIIA